jgi:hypothetical protein
MFFTLVKMLLVGIAHIVLVFFLYYGRIRNISPFFHYDIFVFIIPAVFAFSGYFYLAWFNAFLTNRFAAKIALVSIIAFFAMIMSGMCAITVAFNCYGT